MTYSDNNAELMYDNTFICKDIFKFHTKEGKLGFFSHTSPFSSNKKLYYSNLHQTLKVYSEQQYKHTSHTQILEINFPLKSAYLINVNRTTVNTTSFCLLHFSTPITHNFFNIKIT
jgi:hypothetical protein